MADGEADIESTLKQRGSVYGDFRENGVVAQGLKDVMRDSPNWDDLPPYMKEGLDLIALKLSRMLTGDPMYPDNIHDIVGYSKLMEDRMAQDQADILNEQVVAVAKLSEIANPQFLSDPIRGAMAANNKGPQQ